MEIVESTLLVVVTFLIAVMFPYWKPIKWDSSGGEL